jgi:hypothetical protein
MPVWIGKLLWGLLGPVVVGGGEDVVYTLEQDPRPAQARGGGSGRIVGGRQRPRLPWLSGPR